MFTNITLPTTRTPTTTQTYISHHHPPLPCLSNSHLRNPPSPSPKTFPFSASPSHTEQVKTMAESEEDWVRLAMGDACLVADLLLRILRDPPPSSRSWLDWTVRGRRTRPQLKKESAPTPPPTEPKLEQARASPSTPLSWSGGGASEESPSPPDDFNAPRSKAPLASGAPANTTSAALSVTAGKRPRQKKRSLFELKEEESLLWKERQSLEQELVSLRLRVEKERATNESLKRLKANTISTKQRQSSPRSHLQRRDASDSEVTPQQPHGPHGCSGQNNAQAPETALLPDLNLPLEE